MNLRPRPSRSTGPRRGGTANQEVERRARSDVVRKTSNRRLCAGERSRPGRDPYIPTATDGPGRGGLVAGPAGRTGTWHRRIQSSQWSAPPARRAAASSAPSSRTRSGASPRARSPGSPTRTRPVRSPRRAPRSWPPTLDDAASLERAFAGAHRRVLRHQLLGALLGRTGRSPRPAPWRRRGPRRRAARGLVHARGHAPPCPALRRPDADPPRALQGPPLRRQGRGGRGLRRGKACRPRSCCTSFYWDNLIHFGMGPRRDADGTAGVHRPHGRQEAARHRGRGHRPLRLRRLQRGPGDGRSDRRHRRAST